MRTVLVYCFASATFAHLLSAGEPVSDAKPAGISERIHAASLAWFDAYTKGEKLNELPPIAESIADKLIAGGNLYVTGDPAFADEWNWRAGGLAGVKIWQQGVRMTAKDVLLIGVTTPNERTARTFQHGVITEGYGGFTQALTIYIGSQNWPQFARMQEMVLKERFKNGLYFLDTGAPEAQGWENICAGQVGTLAVSWTLECEIISALSRKGKTAAIFGSIFAPGAEEFDKKIDGKFIVDEPKIDPIEAGKLGREYLTICRKQLAAFQEKGIESLRAGAKKVADCQKRKGVIFTLADGHFWPKGVSIPESLSRVFIYGPAWQWENHKGMKAEDTLLYFGYIKYPKESVDAALQAGSDAVVLCVDEIPANDKVTPVRLSWEAWDGAVALPSYPYKPGPSSAVVQLPQWYSLMAEAEALLKK